MKRPRTRYDQRVKRFAPHTDRNRDAILAVLQKTIPAPGTVLEIGAGTGQHAVYFAGQMPSIAWIPTERDEQLVDSLAAWRAEAGLPNLRAPRHLDVTTDAAHWAVPAITAMVAIDFVHAAPWAATVGLLTAAGQLLPPGGILLLYGPFRRGAAPLPQRWEELALELRRKSPALDLREVDEVTQVAQSRGLTLADIEEVPGHNLMLRYRRPAQ